MCHLNTFGVSCISRNFADTQLLIQNPGPLRNQESTPTLNTVLLFLQVCTCRSKIKCFQQRSTGPAFHFTFTETCTLTISTAVVYLKKKKKRSMRDFKACYEHFLTSMLLCLWQIIMYSIHCKKNQKNPCLKCTSPSAQAVSIFPPLPPVF